MGANRKLTHSVSYPKDDLQGIVKVSIDSLMVALLRHLFDTLMHLANEATSNSRNILLLISLSNLTSGSLLLLRSASSAIRFFASLDGELERDPAGVLLVLARASLPLRGVPAGVPGLVCTGVYALSSSSSVCAASDEAADAEEPIGGERLLLLPPERASWSRRVALFSAAWSKSLDMVVGLTGRSLWCPALRCCVRSRY